jgi:hypothetical protein
MSVALVDKLIRLISLKHDLEREFNMQGFLTKTQDSPEPSRRACPRADAGAAAICAGRVTNLLAQRQTPENLTWKTS